MPYFTPLLLGVVLLFSLAPLPAHSVDTCFDFERAACGFFARENELLRQRRHAEILAAYNYNTNVTEENRLAMINIAAENAILNKDLAKRIKQANYENVDDELIRRQAKILSNIGNDVLNEQDYKELQHVISSMQTNYATATVCNYNNLTDCTLTLEPHVQERLSNSRDPKELSHYWQEWYNKAGTPMRNNFKKYVQLSGKAAHLNNYPSYADYWVHFYEDPDIEENLDNAYKAILPLYREIHGYVRHRLNAHYGDDVVPPNGNIPMHLLGNMWAQTWNEPIELYTPFPEAPFIDVTAEMKKQGYTVRKMFDLGDKFFQSLNMRALPESFWNLSVLERPSNRSLVCHASAWDMFQDGDVRIKMCTEINTHYLYVVYHELGHIQYYMQYENQPVAFRAGPNPGFHEAVGDVVALSVSTAKHLNRIGLQAMDHLDEKSRINELFKRALSKVVFLPFAYTMDKYRYGVFRGDIDDSNLNCAFWQMRSQYSGVEPPVERTERDFDATAKYHVSADVEYLRYFASHIFQFQFYKSMCVASNQYMPNDTVNSLDNCDLYNSKEAGRAFTQFLSVGASKHWKTILKEFTGDDAMNPSALLEYFEPLYEWLKRENKRLGVTLGWDRTNKVTENCCPAFST